MRAIDQDTQAPRLIRPAATALSRALTRAWSLPPRRNRVAVVRDVAVPMSDGTVLRADHYLPVTDRRVATVLVRSPYGRGFPYNMGSAQLISERGFHVLLQSCRGTFGSGGEFDPMRREAADGQDTVAWLRQQHWFDGRLATYGLSYLGFVQWALALDPPPELAAAVIQVGPHDFSQAAYHHGAFDLQNFLGWCEMISHQETTGGLAGLWRMATTDRRLRPALNGLPVTASARDLLGTGAPWFEGWPASSPGTARFRYDPADPTPSAGGAVMTLNAGVRDNQAVKQRADVLVFSSEPLAEPVEILGEVAAELSVARDNPHADLFVRLCDVDEKGRSRNVCDGIVRLTGPDPDDGVVRVPLIGAGYRFAPGHRIRLQVAGGAHPRFTRNPGTGHIEAPARDLVPTGYQIDLASSALVMPVTR